MATTLLLQAIALALMLWRLAPASAQRPGCRDRCGNITVPYPFGIGARCFRDDGLGGFQLVCDDTRSPPRLAIYGYDHQLGDLSLAAGEAQAYLNAMRDCYNDTGGFVGGKNAYMSIGTSPYLFSPENRLVALGCPNLGYLVDTNGYYVSGCMSVCRPSQFTIRGSAPAWVACQSAIPPNFTFFEPHQLNFPRPRGQGDGDPIFSSNSTASHCVFLVEAEWISSSNSDRAYLNQTGDFSVPVVLDWAIRNAGNYSAAKRNATDYACQSANSGCVDSTNGVGYRCNCSKGYNGNPYLDAGCRDIDECQHRDKYPCYGVCTNTPARSYSCECPQGMTGDAYTNNGCRPKDKFR